MNYRKFHIFRCIHDQFLAAWVLSFTRLGLLWLGKNLGQRQPLTIGLILTFGFSSPEPPIVEIKWVVFFVA